MIFSPQCNLRYGGGGGTTERAAEEEEGELPEVPDPAALPVETEGSQVRVARAAGERRSWRARQTRLAIGLTDWLAGWRSSRRRGGAIALSLGWAAQRWFYIIPA